MRRSAPSRTQWLVALGLLLAFLSLGSLGPPLPASAGPRAQTDEPSVAVPTPSPADGALAASFARQGRYEAAIGAYLAVIDEGTASERLNARLKLAQAYLDDGQASQAAAQLEAYLLEATGDVRGAQYLLAEALSATEDWAGALPLYEAYIDGDGDASAYARLGRAQALARLGFIFEAAAAAEHALVEDLPSSIRVEFILTMAAALEGSLPESGLTWYDRLRDESSAPADQALALWRSAAIRDELGDPGAIARAWLTIVQEYPATQTALAIIADPPAEAAELHPFYSGLVYYRDGQSEAAKEAFQAALQPLALERDDSLAARASYYLAVLDETAGEMELALASYRSVVALDADVDLADHALWWRGRLLEQLDRDVTAMAAYETLVSDYAASEWTPEARFRLDLLEYDRGRFANAAGGFAEAARNATGNERERALLWYGKALAAADEDEDAERVWDVLRQEAPYGYYGLRAAVLLGDGAGRLQDAGLDEPFLPDWSAVETWLVETIEASPSEWLDRSVFDEHWATGRALLALGIAGSADAEFALLLEAAGRDVPELYQLTSYFHGAGLDHHAARAATRLLTAVSEDEAVGAPADLWRLAYPAPYVELLRDAADDWEVPDLLLLALIRQESFFDPLAGSPAGALGLTQVVARTGETIAREEGLGEFETEHLYRPEVSLQVGARYLGDQLRTFDGDFYATLAAYNGGPTAAVRWSEAAGDDIDRFVAEIEFGQTVAYVRLVSENLARYRQLYQDLDVPALPND